MPRLCRRRSSDDRAESQRGRDAETSEPSRAAGGNGTGAARGSTVRRVLQKLAVELPWDPASPLLGVSPEELPSGTLTNTCMPMFLVAFIHDTGWERARCPSTGDWMNNMVQTHTGMLSGFKKEGNSETCYHMDEPRRHCARCRRTDTA